MNRYLCCILCLGEKILIIIISIPFYFCNCSSYVTQKRKLETSNSSLQWHSIHRFIPKQKKLELMFQNIKIIINPPVSPLYPRRRSLLPTIFCVSMCYIPFPFYSVPISIFIHS
jgi:hypothetical protein